ncbi:DNRLRE domain-containing protein [Nitrococcus mobilis]|uniref:Carbohydrate-binding module family 96 domain-containing protein n=1 Tax=Nitrococcus mobilis Nb-231 TaxID=314278 RepID=A4BR56_9GAMM|nr:DNRLRE domain-containing protein [Nitrococcus mobilis]EAR21678.1 hypothetical protein NB231_03075 [Nitrococcus mobilis Nb-231]
MLLSAAVVMMPATALAVSTEIIPAQADVYVFEGNPDGNTASIALLQAGVGRGRKVGRIVAYIRFGLADIPKSSFFKKTRVTRATVSLFAQSTGLARADSHFLVSVARCSDSSWIEAKMAWSNRACPALEQAEDVVAIDGTELPQLFQWDVAQSVSKAVRSGGSRLTFVVSAFRIPKLTGGEREIIPEEQFGSKESVGFVRFWSRERAGFGRTGVPTLRVTYEREDTELARFMKTIVAIVSALGAFLGIWGSLRRFTHRQG